MQPIDGLADSKKLSPERREQLAEQIRSTAIAWRVVSIPAAEIDRILLNAAEIAFQRHVIDGLAPGSVADEGARETGSRPAVAVLTRCDPADVFAVKRGSLLAPTFRPYRRRHGQAATSLLAGL